MIMMKPNRAFKVGFLIGAIAFIVLNVISAAYTFPFPDRHSSVCFDCYESWGFPLTAHESGTMLHLDHFIWSGVIANAVIALLGSAFFALLFDALWHLIRSKSGKFS
jgi:hypothetical protein